MAVDFTNRKSAAQMPLPWRAIRCDQCLVGGEPLPTRPQSKQGPENQQATPRQNIKHRKLLFCRRRSRPYGTDYETQSQVGDPRKGTSKAKLSWTLMEKKCRVMYSLASWSITTHAAVARHETGIRNGGSEPYAFCSAYGKEPCKKKECYLFD